MNDNLPDMPQSSGPSPTDGMLTVAVQRSIAEVQASIIIAKRFPRDPAASIARIQAACGDVSLAEDAEYEYSRGGSDISGPSIRLAEVVAQNWGNVDFGIKEVEQRQDGSTVSAYCWDKETNTRSELSFEVKHIRHTRNGSYDLSDPRDIYENVANLGARRLRARIMAVIPRHVFDAAVQACHLTLKEKAPVTAPLIQKMVTAFEAHGVTKAMLEKFLGRTVSAETVSSGHVARLRRIDAALRDGLAKVEDFFKPDAVAQEGAGATPTRGTAAVRAAVQRPAAKAPEAATGPAPAPAATPSPNLGKGPVTRAITARCADQGLDLQAVQKLHEKRMGKEWGSMTAADLAILRENLDSGEVKRALAPAEPAQAEDQPQETMPPADWDETQAKKLRQKIALRLAELGVAEETSRHAFLLAKYGFPEGLKSVPPEELPGLLDWFQKEQGTAEAKEWATGH